MDTSRSDEKAELRKRFRTLRRDISDRPERSARIWDHVRALPEYGSAGSVMLFDSVPGEPETADWKIDAIDSGRNVFVPEQNDLPSSIDVVVVPGLAFTPSGARLGQGGGWYDRFLASVSTSSIVGVCFHDQLIDELPVEPHDFLMNRIVTERGICGRIHTPS